MEGDWRDLYNEELHNLYYSPNIIRNVKSRRIRWTGYVEGMWEKRMYIGYWWKRQKERDH
jgi:hypothetical protein